MSHVTFPNSLKSSLSVQILRLFDAMGLMTFSSPASCLLFYAPPAHILPHFLFKAGSTSPPEPPGTFVAVQARAVRPSAIKRESPFMLPLECLGALLYFLFQYRGQQTETQPLRGLIDVGVVKVFAFGAHGTPMI